MKHLVLYCNISKSHLWDLIAKGKFPKGYKFSPKITVWDINEIDEWLDSYEKNN
jgi:predicted DNA-binding transcriptional regulator AlpA